MDDVVEGLFSEDGLFEEAFGEGAFAFFEWFECWFEVDELSQAVVIEEGEVVFDVFGADFDVFLVRDLIDEDLFFEEFFGEEVHFFAKIFLCFIDLIVRLFSEHFEEGFLLSDGEVFWDFEAML